MTVRLEIKPEIEASLNAQAAAMGIPLDAYLQDVIEDLARAQAAPAASL
jgi:predicted HicB family RNase H-like nuclease